MEPAAVIELRNIGKSYGDNVVLRDVSVTIRAGSVHALIGENGAGKSTLGRILGGEVTPDTGTLLLNGHEVSYPTPRHALADGLTVIQQEPSLVSTLSVEQNVFLGNEKARAGVLSRRHTRRRYLELATRLPFELDPDARVSTLSIADQQKVEIMRAVARNARLIVMDEPTSSLGLQETEVLHQAVRRLCEDEGVAVVYVSHFLHEVLGFADELTVLRNGARVITTAASTTSMSELVEAMLGRPVDTVFPDRVAAADHADPVLEVRDLSTSAVEDISFTVGPGEIVGLAGLVGSGRSEVLRAIFGMDPVRAGAVKVAGRLVPRHSIQAAIKAGIGIVPEDRADEGLLLGLSQRLNVTLTHLRDFSTAGVPRSRREDATVTSLLERLDVRPLELGSPVGNLSGGNQQKVLFGRWMTRPPRVLLLDEPTRGVDIGAKVAIYELIVELAGQGVACVVVSSETEELVGLAHRVLVMRKGRIVQTVGQDDLSLTTVMRAALGLTEGAA